MQLRCLALAIVCAASSPSAAQQSIADVEITAQELAPGVSVLFGAGGNMAVSHGEDATVLIDDQFAPLSAKIEAAIAELGADPVHYLINTHWHSDHTGGNEHFGEQGAHIFAHENVRVRMSSEHVRGDNTVPASPDAALPVVTFERGVTLHLNGDTLDVLFLGGGHTDGDSVVRWREKNIVHMGDLYLNIPGWPFVDISSGGNIRNMLFSLDSAIAMMDSETKVIPGHGPMSDRAELIAYRNTIGEAIMRIRALKQSGSSLEDAVAQKPLGSFERDDGFIGAERFIGLVWETID